MKALSPLEKLNLAGQMTTEFVGQFRRQYWSLDKLQQYQLQQIRRVLMVARTQVPHYIKKNLPHASQIRSLADMVEIPILQKSDLVDAPASQVLNSQFQVTDLILSKSSGSTGKALNVYYDIKSFNHFVLAGLRMYFMAFSYWPWCKQTYIYTSPYPFNSLLGIYPMEFISTLNPIDQTIERLRKNPPDLLVCYPSHLRAIADRMSADDFKVICPRAINVNSEMSSPSERAHLAKKFNSFVFDEYSSEELTRIASQCRHLNYHVFDDINYIEIVDDSGRPLPDGQVGQIVGTNLHNVGMPLLRYNQGDRGAITTRRCPCGRGFRILEKLEGRKNDAFTLSTGETFSSGYLLDLTYSVFLDYPDAVRSFCLVQVEPDIWQLELVPGQNWSNRLDDKILHELKTKVSRDNIQIKCVIVPQVRTTTSGKSNPIVSLVKS